MTSYSSFCPSPGERATRECQHMLARSIEAALRQLGAAAAAAAERRRRAASSTRSRRTPRRPIARSTTGTGRSVARPAPRPGPGSLTIAAASVLSAPASQPGLALKTTRRGRWSPPPREAPRRDAPRLPPGARAARAPDPSRRRCSRSIAGPSSAGATDEHARGRGHDVAEHPRATPARGRRTRTRRASRP